MKSLFIIDTYPSTDVQKQLLIDCISRLKKTDFDIMVVSHLPIPSNIQDMVDYVIYDSDNSFLPGEMTPFFWVTLFGNMFRVFNSGHTLAITRNMQNSLLLSKSLGYEFFYFLEYDVLFDDQDLIKLVDLKNQMISENKSMILFEPHDFYECGSHVYETLFFGGNIDYLLSKFIPPKNLDEWIESKMGYTLEVAFFEKLSGYSEDFIIIPEHSSTYFNHSDINVYRYGLMVSELLYNHNEPDTPILLLYKSRSDIQEYHIKVYLNDTLIHEMPMCEGCWWVKDFKIDGSVIKTEIYLGGELQEIKTYHLNDDINDKIKLKGDVRREQ